MPKDTPTDISFSQVVPARLAACEVRVQARDGHGAAAVDAALMAAKAATDRPSLIALKTVNGVGAPDKAGIAAAHGAPLSREDAAAAKASIGRDAAPFEAPAALAERWRRIGRRGAAAWRDRAGQHARYPPRESGPRARAACPMNA